MSAWFIAKLSLKKVEPKNADKVLGVVAHDIGSYSRTVRSQFQLMPDNGLDVEGNFIVRLL